MGRLLGHHAMQLGNPEHIVGKFNPHLETLLRVTADEALFVGDPKHRNALFGLITENDLTIEPKNCGLYTAVSYLNLSITSNSDHFLPVSNTARRFFIPVVSAARKQDFAYFAALQEELDHGGYEALLYHLLYEVDLDRLQRPRRAANGRLAAATRPRPAAARSVVVRAARDRHPLGSRPSGASPGGQQRLPAPDRDRDQFALRRQISQIRYVNQLGIYDQARRIEPRLRNFTSDHRLGRFLSEMGCDNNKKVLRRAGWTFPLLTKCRTAWEARYPNWKWRNPEIAEWKAEDGDEGRSEVEPQERGEAEHASGAKRHSGTLAVPLIGEGTKPNRLSP